MRTGKVKFFNRNKKFGFIIDNETKQEYYVHIKDVTGKINDNALVEFDLKEAAKGSECINVKVLE